ncbi:hypothetical protein IFO70_39700 [Phormidium tenue FACHB-886]|nr:hypothetical protein [Phormidium tenue FACHB-886]
MADTQRTDPFQERTDELKLSELGTQIEGRTPDLIDWLLPLISAQQTLYELP